jgi:hypothetical protein
MEGRLTREGVCALQDRFTEQLASKPSHSLILLTRRLVGEGTLACMRWTVNREQPCELLE